MEQPLLQLLRPEQRSTGARSAEPWWAPRNTAEYLSLITIKGMHLPDDADYSKRLQVLEDQVAPGGRDKIGYFDPKFKTLSNNHG